jgi:PiT family inorganic phosphate transporter
MGVITLALIGSGHWSDTSSVPFWVKASCALAISLGTFLGGWRIIRTVGKGLVEITSPSGMAAESSSAAIILVSSHLGLPLSTTQVATGSILGTGIGKPGAQVRWAVAGRMVIAWCITMPAAGLTGAVMWWVGDLFNGIVGALVMAAILLAVCGWMWMRSRLTQVSAENVNDEWQEAPARQRTAA